VLPLVDEHVATHGDFPVGDLHYSQLRAELPQLVDDMQVGIERVRSILGELKTFAMPVGPQTSSLDLNDVMRRAVALVGKTIAKARNRFEVEYYTEPLWVDGHLQRIEQVVVNLLLNAQQSLPEAGGEISVSFHPSLTGGCHSIRIRDNGCGMTQETLRHLTDPFYTTRRESGGTGLGLSISQRIVSDYGGEIHFDSSPGQGTTVDVSLPMSKS